MRILPFLFITVALYGCVPAGGISESSSSSSSVLVTNTSASFSTMTASSIAPNTDQNTYLTYRDGVEGAGRPVLLFFYSSDSSDLFSQKTNTIITELYRTNVYILPTYRADFTTAVTPQRKYHVLLPDTIVLIDAEGNEVASQLHPTEDDIKSFLTRFKAS